MAKHEATVVNGEEWHEEKDAGPMQVQHFENIVNANDPTFKPEVGHDMGNLPIKEHISSQGHKIEQNDDKARWSNRGEIFQHRPFKKAS